MLEGGDLVGPPLPSLGPLSTQLGCPQGQEPEGGKEQPLGKGAPCGSGQTSRLGQQRTGLHKETRTHRHTWTPNQILGNRDVEAQK